MKHIINRSSKRFTFSTWRPPLGSNSITRISFYTNRLSGEAVIVASSVDVPMRGLSSFTYAAQGCLCMHHSLHIHIPLHMQSHYICNLITYAQLIRLSQPPWGAQQQGHILVQAILGHGLLCAPLSNKDGGPDPALWNRIHAGGYSVITQ